MNGSESEMRWMVTFRCQTVVVLTKSNCKQSHGSQRGKFHFILLPVKRQTISLLAVVRLSVKIIASRIFNGTDENASNDFNQCSSAISLSRFPFYRQKCQNRMANCRLQTNTICAVRAIWSNESNFRLSLCTIVDIKGSRINRKKKKCEMLWLATAAVAVMAISHHRNENCRRRAHNKTRTLPFVFANDAVAADYAAACIDKARIPPSVCRK